jgi:hypothetical protein
LTGPNNFFIATAVYAILISNKQQIQSVANTEFLSKLLKIATDPSLSDPLIVNKCFEIAELVVTSPNSFPEQIQEFAPVFSFAGAPNCATAAAARLFSSVAPGLFSALFARPLNTFLCAAVLHSFGNLPVSEQARIVKECDLVRRIIEFFPALGANGHLLLLAEMISKIPGELLGTLDAKWGELLQGGLAERLSLRNYVWEQAHAPERREPFSDDEGIQNVDDEIIVDEEFIPVEIKSISSIDSEFRSLGGESVDDEMIVVEANVDDEMIVTGLD